MAVVLQVVFKMRRRGRTWIYLLEGGLGLGLIDCMLGTCLRC